MSKKPAARPPGRPPSGPGGLKVSEYPQLTLRVPPSVRLQLRALAVVQQRPVAAVVENALRAYVDTLTPAQRRALQTFVLET